MIGGCATRSYNHQFWIFLIVPSWSIMSTKNCISIILTLRTKIFRFKMFFLYVALLVGHASAYAYGSSRFRPDTISVLLPYHAALVISAFLLLATGIVMAVRKRVGWLDKHKVLVIGRGFLCNFRIFNRRLHGVYCFNGSFQIPTCLSGKCCDFYAFDQYFSGFLSG